MAKRVQTQSGVQQVGVATTAQPLNTFNPINLDPRAIQGIIDLAPLSASVAAVARQLNQDYKAERLEGGQAAIAAFAAANPALVQDSLGGTEEQRAAVRKKLKQAVADGTLPESANPILYELWDEVTMQSKVGELEQAIRLEMDSMTQVQANGQRVDPKTYEQVRAEQIEKLGVMSTPGASSVFGKRVLANGLAVMDNRFRQEVGAAVAENVRRVTRDGVRQQYSTILGDKAGKLLWEEQDYADIAALDAHTSPGVADAKELWMEALLAQATKLGATDADAALNLLANAGQIKFGPTALEDDASEYKNGTYSAALGAMVERLEEAGDAAAYRAARDRDVQWDADTWEVKKLVAGESLRLQREGMTVEQVREFLTPVVLAKFGDNGPLLLEEMNSQLDGAEARAGKSVQAIVDRGFELIARGQLDDARTFVQNAIDDGSLVGQDAAALAARVDEAQQNQQNLESDPVFRRKLGQFQDAAKRLRASELTGAQRRILEEEIAEWEIELTEGYLDQKVADPVAAQKWLEAKTGELTQRVNEKAAQREARSTQYQTVYNEGLRRYQDQTESIQAAQAQGILSNDEVRQLTAANDARQVERAAKFTSREFLQVAHKWDDRILENTPDFENIRAAIGEPIIDPETGRQVVSPTEAQFVGIVNNFAKERFSEKLDEIYATAEPSQFPALEAQALREISDELESILGKGAKPITLDLRAPEKMEVTAAISEGQNFANSFAPGATPTIPKQVNEPIFSSYTKAVQTGKWSDFEQHRVIAVEQARKVLSSAALTPEQRGQVAVDALSLYGIPYQQVLDGDVQLVGQMPPLLLVKETSGVRRGIKMRSNGITPDRVHTGIPFLYVDQTGSVDSFQQKQESAQRLQQAKAILSKWYSENPGKKPPADIQFQQKLINDVETKMGMLNVPLSTATINPFMVRLFGNESELERLRKDTATWNKLLSSKNFSTTITPGSEEETAFIQAQKAAIRRARR